MRTTTIRRPFPVPPLSPSPLANLLLKKPLLTLPIRLLLLRTPPRTLLRPLTPLQPTLLLLLVKPLLPPKAQWPLKAKWLKTKWLPKLRSLSKSLPTI